MNSKIGDFAILEKSHDCEDKKMRMKEVKQAMDLLKVPITEEELHKCVEEMNNKKCDVVELLSMIVSLLLSRQQSLEDKHSGLTICSEGCGRRFSKDALSHHAKICKKVFQTKRAKFNSSKARQTDEMAKVCKHDDKDVIPSPKKKARIPLSQIKKEFAQLPKDDKPTIMICCPEGCGRSFRSECLDKHAKVCKKVFQTKRAKFDSAKARKTEEMAAVTKKIKDDKMPIKKEKKERISIAEIKKQYYDKLQNKESENPELKACLECNRKFNIESLKKHAKVCKKVFHAKRSKFDSAKTRRTEEMAAVAAKIKKADKKEKHSHKKCERVPISQIKKQYLSLLHNDENKDPELMMRCPEGCGRTFKAEALEAHAHVCKQVFQHKRDKFDSVMMRKSKDLRNFETIPYKKVKKTSRRHSEEAHADDLHKWKAQSNAFRIMIKALKAEKKAKKEQPKWKCQSETLRSVVKTLRGEKRSPLESISINTQNTQTENVCCPNCGVKVNSSHRIQA